MGRGDTKVSDIERVRTKERKSKKKREKVRELTMRENTPKNYVSCGYK